jgi:uncharacterized membrane protein HdeD (DUF308 family)
MAAAAAAKYIKNARCQRKDGKLNGRMLLGVALIVIGIIALVYQGFTYTTHKKVLDIGPIQATKEEHRTIPVPPVIGIIAVISGVAVLALGRGK